MFHMMFNAYWEGLAFEVPLVDEFSGHGWKRWIDTSLESPEDICSWHEAAEVRETVYTVRPRSLAVLVSRVKNH